MTTRRLDAADATAIVAAADLLRRGLPVVLPTDTVYGVGVLPFDAAAVERLYAVKGRPAEKGIPILLGDVADVAHVAGIIPSAAAALMAHFWPGPLTLLCRDGRVAANLSPDDTIAVRVPDHAVARAHSRRERGAGYQRQRLCRPPARAPRGAAALDGRINAVLDDGPSPNVSPRPLSVHRRSAGRPAREGH
jgi:L-threonylcarbamoyladenylate synthase